MARLAVQYVALRKQSSLQQNTSTSSGNADNVIAHNRSNFKNAAATQRANNQYSHNANTSPKRFFKPNSAPTAPRTNTVICAYCKKPKWRFSTPNSPSLVDQAPPTFPYTELIYAHW